MPKFCHNCGSPINNDNVKFCPDCGTGLIIKADGGVSTQVKNTTTASKIINNVPVLDEEEIQDKPVSYKELGNKLEEFTSSILQSEGWTVQKNVRDNLESGARAEFDIIAIKKQKDRTLVRIVECKNYASAVGREKIDAFAKKIESYTTVKNAIPLFVAINFSSDARKEADFVNVTLWDSKDLIDKMFAIHIGRYVGQQKEIPFKNALPLFVDYLKATHLNLENANKVSVNNIKLYWRPFYKIVYSVFASKTDPKGKLHKVNDNGACIVDAEDGMVLNLPIPKERNSIFDMPDIKFRDSEEDLFVAELESLPEQNYKYPVTDDFQVVKIEPKISKRFARECALRSIIYKNTETFTYEVNSRRSSESLFDVPDTRDFIIIPKKSDITIKETLLVFVPKWDMEFLSGSQLYRREIVGHKGTIIADTIRYCPQHKVIGLDIIKKNTVAVCEVDGKALCKDHIFKCPICNNWFCNEHSAKCTTCGAHFCQAHIVTCADCDAPVCGTCANICPICGEAHCKKHWAKCEKCGKNVCTSCTTYKSNMLVFKKYTCKKCS